MNRFAPPPDSSASDSTAVTELVTPYGDVSLLWYHQELIKVNLGTFKPTQRRPSIRRYLPSHEEGQKMITDLMNYFKGEQVEFDVPLPQRAGSDAQRRIWEALKAIPYGQCETYVGLSKRLGLPEKSARVLLSVCGLTPLPLIYPSHRVVGPHGALAGFAAGTPWRKALLELEGVPIQHDRVQL